MNVDFGPILWLAVIGLFVGIPSMIYFLIRAIVWLCQHVSFT